MDQSNGGDQFQYRGEASEATQNPSAVQVAPSIKSETGSPILKWNASEFIHHQKSVGWFVPLIFGGVILTVGTYLLTKDILATLVVATAAATFGVFARQKPRTLTYSLFPNGIKVGSKSYTYDDFKSFSIIQEGALYSIFLEPIKRFIPPLTVYFPPEEGEHIFNVLADRLPHIERQADPVERLMRKIRF